jgi:hydrogenase maturation protease
MGRVRVTGLGNEWAGDDAVGLIAAQKLREKNIPGVEIMVREIPDWEMFEQMEDDDLLIFIDACDSGGEPGTVYQLRPDEIMERGVRHCSSHGLGLAEWLSMAEVLGSRRGRVIIVAVEIEGMEMGASLSKPVEGAIPRLLEKIERIANV